VADASSIASTPDGKTAYVIGLLPKGVNGNKSVLSPISTATNKAGTPITVGQGEFDLTIAP
jgi:hypothetical protein